MYAVVKSIYVPEVNVTFARVTRKSWEIPNSSINNSGFCTSISVRSRKISVFPSAVTATWSNTFAPLDPVSFSRRKITRLATAVGSPIFGKVDKSPVAEMPFSSSKTAVGNLENNCKGNALEPILRIPKEDTKYTQASTLQYVPFHSDHFGLGHVACRKNTRSPTSFARFGIRQVALLGSSQGIKTLWHRQSK